MLTDKQKQGLVLAALVRSGVIRDRKSVDEANGSEYAGAGLLTMSREALRDELGDAVDGMRPRDIWDRLYYGLYSTPQGFSVGTSTLSTLLSNAATQAVLAGWNEAKPSYSFLVNRVEFADFKLNDVYAMRNVPDVLEIPEGQPPMMCPLSDSVEKTKLRTVGRCLLVSEEALINDRTDIISTLPMMFGAAVQRSINFDFWTLLLNNTAVSSTGRAFFNAVDGNISAPAAALTDASLRIAVRDFLRMAAQPADGGASRAVNGLLPRYIITSPDNAMAGRILCAGPYSPEVNEEDQNWKMSALVEPFLDTLNIGNSTQWFLAAFPRDLGGFALVTLRGRPTPVVETRVGGVADVKGLFVDVRHSYRIALCDSRAMLRNIGA